MYTYKKIYIQYKKQYKIYLIKTIKILNSLHQTKYPKSFWEPIIGLYLRRFIINFLFFKYKIGNKQLKNKFFMNNFFVSYKEFSIYFSFQKIKKINYYTNNQKKKLVPANLKFLNLKQNFNLYGKLTIFFINLLIFLRVTNTLLSINFFSNSQKLKFLIKTKFKFIPFIIPKLKTNKYKRLDIHNNRILIIQKYLNNYDDDLLENIIYHMPINYLELFKSNIKLVNNYLLTNNFFCDGNEANFDIIKFYIAKLKTAKKKIIIGQHAARSGREDFDIFFDYQKSISDNYVTWGTTNKFIKSINAGTLRLHNSLKRINIKTLNFDKKKYNKICFILCSFSSLGDVLSDNYFENLSVENSRIELIKILKRLTNHFYLKSRQGSFLKNKRFYKNIKCLTSAWAMEKIIGNFGIVFFERLSVGILECLHLNQPIIFFSTKNSYQYQNKEYKKMIKLLKLSKIYIEDKNEILRIVSSEQNYLKWWNNENNIKFRKIFIKKYAKVLEIDSLSKYIN